MKDSSYFLIVIIALMIALISWALTYPDIKTKLLPLIFCATTLVLSLAQLAREVRDLKSSKTDVAERKKDSMQVKKGYASSAGWIAGLFFGVYLLGFLIATPIFVFLYPKLHGRGWGISVALAAVFLVLTYILFVLGLRIHLYSGVLFAH